ncbi:MAG: hypothetical protein ACQEQY_07530 [Halobacteriota archaeon]
MTQGSGRTRRQLLSGLTSAAVVGALAGCADLLRDDDGSGEPTGEPGTAATAAGTVTGDSTTGPGTGTGTQPELDFREANVVDVAVDGEDGSYTFDVTLHHDDDGEDGYANWWQVERVDGTRLGRRELLHAHSQQPFTRSATVDIPADVTCVVVRGHDETHGYGGQSMTVAIESGETRAIAQGAERQPVDESDCP